MERWLAGRLMKERGLVSCQQPTHRVTVMDSYMSFGEAAHTITDYIVGYYSTLRQHEYNG